MGARNELTSFFVAKAAGHFDSGLIKGYVDDVALSGIIENDLKNWRKDMGNCCGNCGSCAGCARELVLTGKEIDFLKKLGQIPFLPVARNMGDLTPVYLEDGDQEEMSLILQCLEKKGLISLDFDKPLRGFDQSAYASYPIRGSMALTERGQKVLEMMEYQGIQGE